MEFLPEKGYKRILVISFYIILASVCIFLFFKYLLGLVLPFIIAWLISLIIRPMAVTLHTRTRLPVKVLSIIFVVLTVAFFAVFVFLLLDRLFFELGGIISHLNDNSDTYIQNAFFYVNRLLEKTPFLKTFGSKEELFGVLSRYIGNMIGTLSADLPKMIADVFALLPNVFFVSLILVMASYYFCADYDIVTSSLLKLMPQNVRSIAMGLRSKLKQVFIGVMKGYLLTMLITFFELYVGFLILRVDYAFTVALITAFVDVLPILGVGTVLVPWAIIKLIGGMYFEGFGLLILFAVVSVIRQIIQPKIIGTSIGLHPLATLFAMYIGFRICGLIGLIFFPVLVIVGREVVGRASP